MQWQMATGCVDPETVANALWRICQLLDKTPTEGIPDAIERLLATIRARDKEITRLRTAVGDEQVRVAAIRRAANEERNAQERELSAWWSSR